MKTNFLKTGLALVAIAAFSFGNAQQVSGTVGKGEDRSLASEIDGTIRVIDNKGTKKFLQVKNGLTLFTDQTPDGGYVSTWQLGGTLTDNTYIGAAGQVFSLDGLKLVDTSTESAATTATDQSLGSNATTISGTGTASTDTGYTLLARDEATGEIKKILLSDIIESGHDVLAGVAGTTTYDITGGVDLGVFSRVWVYRNGAKLVAGVDYTITDADTIELIEVADPDPNSWSVIDGDVIEVQYFK